MDLRSALRKYQNEPRFKTLVDWLAQIVWSGSRTPEELRAAASLAIQVATLREKEQKGRARPVVSDQATQNPTSTH